MPLLPTYQFQGETDTFANVSIHYSLRFEVKVSGLFTNSNVDMPIVIGTELYFN